MDIRAQKTIGKRASPSHKKGEEKGGDFVQVDTNRAQRTKWQGVKPKERRRRGIRVCFVKVED